MPSLMDRLKGAVERELIEIIDWSDPGRETLAYRFPDEDRFIKNGAQLTVRESQAAQFVHAGQYGDLFQPGLHALTSRNIPILTTLASWKYGFESPFKAEVYFVTTRLFTGQKWGTQHPVMLRDPDFGLVRAKAYGTYDLRVEAPATFLRAIVGTSPSLTLEQFEDTMRPRLVGLFSETLATARLPIIDVATKYREVARTIAPAINEQAIKDYGISIANFLIENISVPTEVEQAIDKRASMSAIGNLDDLVKYEMAKGLSTGGGSGLARTAAEFAIGVQMAQALTKKD